jgi:hypothetical protein
MGAFLASSSSPKAQELDTGARALLRLSSAIELGVSRASFEALAVDILTEYKLLSAHRLLNQKQENAFADVATALKITVEIWNSDYCDTRDWEQRRFGCYDFSAEKLKRMGLVESKQFFAPELAGIVRDDFMPTNAKMLFDNARPVVFGVILRRVAEELRIAADSLTKSAP